MHAYNIPTWVAGYCEWSFESRMFAVREVAQCAHRRENVFDADLMMGWALGVTVSAKYKHSSPSRLISPATLKLHPRARWGPSVPYYAIWPRDEEEDTGISDGDKDEVEV